MSAVAGEARIVTFTVRDLGKARAFYVDGLGFAVASEEPGRFFMVDLGGFRLCVDFDSDARGGGSSLIFRVPSLEAAARELDARGVRYDRRVGERSGGFLEARDPEGYTLIFTERL